MKDRTIYPMAFVWSGEHMAPLNLRAADRQYVVGQRYRLAVHEDRSEASHRHYFAAIADAFSNLPEELAAEIPSPEHLRKMALIKAGYRDERTIACRSNAEAEKLKAFIKPMDDFAIVLAEGLVVKVYTAKSQSARAMSKEDFQASKQAVLDILAEIIGVTPDQLSKNAGQAA